MGVKQIANNHHITTPQVMKSIIKVLTVCIVMLVALYTHAQVVDGSFGYYHDALRFSQLSMVGSARMQALGGAQVALGGDPSAALVNPAGLGFFNRSVFSFSPMYNANNVSSDFNGTGTTDYRGNFNINNIGLVIEKTTGDISQSKFKGGSIGITLHRVNDFNRNYNYEGFNNDNSIIDSFLQQADGITPSNIEGRGPVSLAYYNYLINPVPGQPGVYDSFVIGFPRQMENIETRGNQYQLNVSYGGNYDDKIYFGGGIGMNTVRYTSKKVYREDSFEFFDSNTNQWVSDDAINSLQLEESLRVNGVGINATFGLIYRPVDAFRVGFSYTTPTALALNDESESFLQTNYNNFYYAAEDTLLRTVSSESDIVVSRFTLTTPSRFSIGMAGFLGKNGFISGDVEFVNYGSAAVNSRDFSTGSDNATINNLYGSAVNFRVGAEYRIQPIMVRVGFNHMGDPMKDSGIDRSISTFSAGVGYRTRDYFLDFTVMNSRFNQAYVPYNLFDGSGPVINLAHNRTTAMVTIGFNF